LIPHSRQCGIDSLFEIGLANINLFMPYAEEASLSITKEVQETSAMFATSTFVAEDAKSLNLVEGEKVYVIGKYSNHLIHTNLSSNPNILSPQKRPTKTGGMCARASRPKKVGCRLTCCSTKSNTPSTLKRNFTKRSTNFQSLKVSCYSYSVHLNSD
jgi:hypothetical protein